MAMQQLRSIENNTPASATDVQWNFGTLENHVNSSLIDRNGTIPMTGQLTLAGAPTSALHATSKQYVDANTGVAVGVIVEYAGTVAPSGWLLCEGAILDQASYPALFAVISTAFNTGGEGGTQFRLPDFRDRSAMGASGTKPRGTLGGSADTSVATHSHTLSGATMTGTASSAPDHIHNTYIRTNEGTYVTNVGSGGGSVQASGPSSSVDYSKPSIGGGSHAHTVTGSVTGSVSPAGVSPTGTNLPPYLAVSKIIKAV